MQRKLKVFGLEEKEANPDQEDGGAVDTYAILLDFMENTLDLGETARLFELQRAHRLGRPVAGKTKPIFARFLRYRDREMAFKACFFLPHATQIKVLSGGPPKGNHRAKKEADAEVKRG